MSLDPRVSEEVLGAITGALEEEKSSPLSRALKSFGATALCLGVLSAPLLLLFKEELNLAWYLALGFWGICLLAGFHLYYRPQPRLAVPGFWSPWVFARILILMTFLTVGEILLCPSFVFLESPLHWAPFESLTHVFMSWGGMRACMLSCGFLFTSIGGLLTFLSVARTLRRSSGAKVFEAVAVAYSTQLPIIGIQAWDEDLRQWVGFWMLGAAIGALLMALAVRAWQGLARRAG